MRKLDFAEVLWRLGLRKTVNTHKLSEKLLSGNSAWRVKEKKSKNKHSNPGEVEVWWLTKGESEFKDSLGHGVRPCLKT